MSPFFVAFFDTVVIWSPAERYCKYNYNSINYKIYLMCRDEYCYFFFKGIKKAEGQRHPYCLLLSLLLLFCE